ATCQLEISIRMDLPLIGYIKKICGSVLWLFLFRIYNFFGGLCDIIIIIIVLLEEQYYFNWTAYNFRQFVHCKFIKINQSIIIIFRTRSRLPLFFMFHYRHEIISRAYVSPTKGEKHTYI